MKKKLTSILAYRLVTSGVAILALILVAAAPVMAAVAAGSIDSVAIKNHSIKTVDIARKAIKNKLIAKGAVTSKKIRNRAIKSAHIKDNTVKSRDIKDGTIQSRDLAAGALKADDFQYTSAKTRTLSVPAAAFQPEKSSDVYTKDYGLYLYATGAGQHCFLAPLNLPDGATLKKITATVWDLSGAGSIQVQLTRNNASGTESNNEYVASVQSAGAIHSWRDLAADADPALATVDNNNFGYFLLARFNEGNSGLKLNRVKVTYEVNQP